MDWLAQSIGAKLGRAEHHLRELEEAEHSGAVSDLVKTRTDRDRKGRVRVRVEEVGDTLPEWSVWIGEAVHDMRSALDHLAYGLNIIGSKKNPPPNETASAFPIYTNRLVYRGSVPKGKPARTLIECFPRGAKTLVESVQPYHGRKQNPYTFHRLSNLADLSKIDKHRRFPIMATTPKNLAIPQWVGRPWLGYLVTEHKIWYRVLKPHTTIVWLTVPALPADVKEPDVNLQLTARIELERGLPETPVDILVPSEPITFTLECILVVIREEVLPLFERWIPGLAVIPRYRKRRTDYMP